MIWFNDYIMVPLKCHDFCSLKKNTKRDATLRPFTPRRVHILKVGYHPQGGIPNNGTPENGKLPIPFPYLWGFENGSGMGIGIFFFHREILLFHRENGGTLKMVR